MRCLGTVVHHSGTVIRVYGPEDKETNVTELLNNMARGTSALTAFGPEYQVEVVAPGQRRDEVNQVRRK